MIFLAWQIYNDGSERSNPFKKHMFSLRELNMLVENLAMHDLSSLSSIVEVSTGNSTVCLTTVVAPKKLAAFRKVSMRCVV